MFFFVAPVHVSGVFFSGPPYTILDAWRHGRVSLVVSPAIIDEYRRVTHELAEQSLMLETAGLDDAGHLRG